MPAITCKSPGKTILFGEHAVVYGFPAIAVPIDAVHLKVSILGAPDQPAGVIRIRNNDTGEDVLLSELPEQNPVKAAILFTAASLNIDRFPAATINISSTIPVASGLGSSAALAVALVRGFSQFLGFNLSNERVNNLAFEVEKIHHGTPSGIDNSVVAFNQPLYFVKGQPLEFLVFKKPLTLVVADSGIRSLTREVVAEVRNRKEQHPDSITPLLSRIGGIAETAKEELREMDLAAIGDLMNENHRLLIELDVSCPELDKLVQAARQAGALGAKLCGSGKGGNMVALAQTGQAEIIRDALKANGALNALITEVK